MKPLNTYVSEAARFAGGAGWGAVRPFDHSTLARPSQAPHERAVQRLREILRAENGAIELYRSALARFEGAMAGRQRELLRQIRMNHVEQAQALGARLAELGQSGESGSGAWGMWGRAMLAMASQFGGTAMLRALKESEEQALADYRRAFGELDTDSRMLLRRQLIPSAQEHIHLLETLVQDQADRRV